MLISKIQSKPDFELILHSYLNSKFSDRCVKNSTLCISVAWRLLLRQQQSQVRLCHDGRYANRLNQFCELEPHEPEPGPKLWAGITGVKFGRTELSIPPIEISRRDLQDEPIFSTFHFFDFGFRVFGCF